MANGIRLATPEDLPAIGELLSSRDGRNWSLEQVQWFLSGLDSNRCIGWVAYKEDKCVAFSNVFLRLLECQGQRWPAAYWANLYVAEKHRQSLWYPRLVMAMFSWIREGHVDFLYACVRLPDVMEGHLRLGFKKVGEIPLLFRPIRPFRLLVRKAKLPQSIEWGCGPFDAVARWFGSGVRRRPNGPVCELTSSCIPGVADQLAKLTMGDPDLIAQSPDLQRACERYQQTREGTSYYLFAVESSVAVARIAEREGVVAAVLMDYAAQDERQWKGLLREVGLFAEQHNADVIIALNGRSARPPGFWRQGDYQLLVWAPRIADLDEKILSHLGGVSVSVTTMRFETVYLGQTTRADPFFQ